MGLRPAALGPCAFPSLAFAVQSKVTLKIGGQEALKVTYAKTPPDKDNASLQRRGYSLLQWDRSHIVLVHYLRIVEMSPLVCACMQYLCVRVCVCLTCGVSLCPSYVSTCTAMLQPAQKGARSRSIVVVCGLTKESTLKRPLCCSVCVRSTRVCVCLCVCEGGIAIPMVWRMVPWENAV